MEPSLHDRRAHVQQHLGNKQQLEQRSMMTKTGGGVAPAVAVALVLLAAAAASSSVRADVSCADVDASLRPCVGYVTGKQAAPAVECCAGVKQLRAMVAPSGTAERRQACECVKQAAGKYQPLNADAIRDLPSQCGEPLPFPLTPNFDCNTISMS